MKAVAIARRLRQPQARQALEQDRQRDRHFEPGERRADAEMDSGPEGDMRVGAAGQVQVGFRKAFGIAIGGAKQEADLLALPEPQPAISTSSSA